MQRVEYSFSYARLLLDGTQSATKTRIDRMEGRGKIALKNCVFPCQSTSENDKFGQSGVTSHQRNNANSLYQSLWYFRRDIINF